MGSVNEVSIIHSHTKPGFQGHCRRKSYCRRYCCHFYSRRCIKVFLHFSSFSFQVLRKGIVMRIVLLSRESICPFMNFPLTNPDNSLLWPSGHSPFYTLSSPINTQTVNHLKPILPLPQSWRNSSNSTQIPPSLPSSPLHPPPLSLPTLSRTPFSPSRKTIRTIISQHDPLDLCLHHRTRLRPEFVLSAANE